MADSPPQTDPAAESLREYLPFLLRDVPASLVDEAALRRMDAIAARMPPSLALAIECRLGAGDDQVDLQQCFRRSEGEFRFLPDAVKPSVSGENLAAVARWQALFAQFADPQSRFHRAIEEVFLEYDLPVDGSVAALPSVFLSLPSDGEEASAILFETLEVLGGEALPAANRQAVERIFAACSQDAFVDSAGFMASRPAAGLRINVKGLETFQLRPFLEACQWPGDIAMAEKAFDEAVDRYDMVTLALDVAAGAAPHFGLECFLSEQPPSEIRWAILLEELAERRMCDPAKAKGFVAARYDLTPPQSDRPWPRSLIRQSIGRPADHFTTFARRLSHIKLGYRQDGLREAKAYFGAGHLWQQASRSGGTTALTSIASRRRPSVGKPAVASGDPASAINAGISMLLRQQLQSGLWRDYCAVGCGEEWVSGFIAAQIFPYADNSARQRIDRALSRLLARQRDTGGWAYSREYSGDADSTAWVMRMIREMGNKQDEALQRGREFLISHAKENGGLGTYVETDAVARAMRVARDISFAGWQQDHPSVTAAAAPFLGEEARRYLVERQQNGCWTCYWWGHPAYPTAMAVDALMQDPADAAIIAVRAACDWARDCVENEGAGEALTDFDLAFCLRILASSPGYGEAAHRAAQGLLSSQREDGSWAPGARMRIPPMGELETGAPKEGLYFDFRGSFTTAAVVGALGEWQTLQREQPA